MSNKQAEDGHQATQESELADLMSTNRPLQLSRTKPTTLKWNHRTTRAAHQVITLLNRVQAVDVLLRQDAAEKLKLAVREVVFIDIVVLEVQRPLRIQRGLREQARK